MEDWQKRVIEERTELNHKIITLSTFISVGGPRFEALAEVDRELLRRQRDAILEYSGILDARIMRFNPGN